jgi:UDP-2,3-diacylglucosamine hydrolase
VPTGSANPLRGLVVSDLHLFARRSDGLERMVALTPRLRETDHLVLNGDIFDFRWSTLSEHAHTVRDAVGWLRKLSESLPNCQIHYVLGNHDCLVEFVPEVERIAAGHANFTWHEYSLRLSDALFLHGDCTHAMMDAAALRNYRNLWSRDGRRHGPATTAYEIADRLGMTRLVHKVHFPRVRTLRRLTHHLDHAQPDWRDSIRQCYFGHTHEPFSDVLHDNIRFHNTGCAIRGMQFNPIAFTVGRTGDHE